MDNTKKGGPPLYFIHECRYNGFRCLYMDIAYYFVHETCDDKNVYPSIPDTNMIILRDGHVFETLIKRVDRIINYPHVRYRSSCGHLPVFVARLTDCAGPSFVGDSFIHSLAGGFRFSILIAPRETTDGATLRDAGRRGVPRAKNLLHRNQTHGSSTSRDARTEPDRNPSSSSSFSRVLRRNRPRRGGHSSVFLKGGKTANHDSWGDACRVNNDDDVCVDVGAGAKRRSRDVVALARGRPRDAKRFVSFVQRERCGFASRGRDANVGDGAERGGSGPDRGWWLQARRRAEDGW